MTRRLNKIKNGGGGDTRGGEEPWRKSNKKSKERREIWKERRK